MNIESIGSRGGASQIGLSESPPAARNPGKNRPTEATSSGAELSQTQAQKPNVEQAAKQLTKFVSTIRPELNFTVDEASGTHVVRVIDSSTKEVIRQIPSEEAIQMAQALDKLQGLFVKETA